MSGIRPLFLFLILSFLFIAPLPANAAESVAPVIQNQPVRVEITGLTFDQANNRYRIGLAIDRPDRIQRVVLNVENEAGTVVIEQFVNPAGSPNLNIDFDANQLGPEGKFIIKIRALDLVGNLIEKSYDFGINE